MTGDETGRAREAFIEEALEMLSGIESDLLDLEKDPSDSEAVSSILRALHTIKGSGAMVGFDEVAAFAHQIETVYDFIRKGKLVSTKSLIDLTLESCDLVQSMIRRTRPEDIRFDDQAGTLLSRLSELCPELNDIKGPGKGLLRREEIPKVPPQGTRITYRIRFRPQPDIFLKGTDPVLLLDELRGLGECLVLVHNDQIPDLRSLDPEKCCIYWDIILTTDRGIDAIKDVFIFIEDECELRIDIIDEGETALDEKDYKKIGEILLEKKDVEPEDLERILRERKPIGEVLVSEGLVPRTRVEAALTEQVHVRRMREQRLKSEVISSLRVSSDKLDRLVNLAGELVTVQARLSQTSFSRSDPELLSIAEEVERLTGELRESAMSMRMVPIGTTFARFRRLVRDLSAELGKEAELITYGGETELDKSVIEKLQDPLVHLIRNSLDHGLESPQIRESSGKPRKGTISLAAMHSGDKVRIEIRDDGAGLDGEGIRIKALEKGLITAADGLSDRDLYPLILLPGFSTSGNVTNISGRGVGLDVVKRAVDSLRGSIEINSEKGAYTDIALSLPLTLAIIDGLLVKISDDFFVLPLSSVEECVELRRKDAGKNNGRHIANVRGQIVPYVSIRDQFTTGGSRPDIEQIVIIVHENRKVGFVVDTVLGEYQTVIKTLGRAFRNVIGISGATILGDGTVALIIDIPGIIRIAEEKAGA